MPTFKFMTPREGHEEFKFDKSNTVELAKAERRFNELVGKGFIAAELIPGGNQRKLREFDPNVEDTVFHAHLQGG
jgi:hypothetical protein